MHRHRRLVTAFVLTIFIAMQAGITAHAKIPGLYQSHEDLAGKIIASEKGSVFETYLDRIPGATALLYEELEQGISLVKSGNAAAIVLDKIVADKVVRQHSDLQILEEPLAEEQYCFAFPKDSPIIDDVNNVIERFISNGLIDNIVREWTGDNPTLSPPESYPKYDGSNGVFRFAHAAEFPPMSFVDENGISQGVDVELALNIAYALNMEFISEDTPANTIFTTISGGKYTMGGCAMTPTPEREEFVDFSEPYMLSATVLVVKKALPVAGTGEFTDVEQLEGRKIGTLRNSINEDLTEEALPDYQSIYANNYNELLDMLRMGQVDAVIMDYFVAMAIDNANDDVAIIPEWLSSNNSGLALRKNSQYTYRVNRSIERYKRDNTILALSEKWFGENSSDEIISDIVPTGTRGTIRVGYAISAYPMSFRDSNGNPGGFIVDLCTTFANDENLGIEYIPMDYSEMLTAIDNGEIDLAANNFVITDERQEKYDMTSTVSQVGRVILVRDKDVVVIRSPWDYIKTGLHSTFVADNNWQTILQGLAVTALLVILFCLLGTIPALLFAFMHVSRIKALRKIAGAVSWLGKWIPFVVPFLMAAVLFSDAEMTGLFWNTAILGAMYTGVFFAEVFAKQMNLVDQKQVLAARALGFSFFRAKLIVMLPQAYTKSIIQFKQQLFMIYQMSAMAGLVGVMDITGVLNGIQQGAPQTVVPLIVAAILYALLGAAICAVLRLVQNAVGRKHRRRKVTGVYEK